MKRYLFIIIEFFQTLLSFCCLLYIVCNTFNPVQCISQVAVLTSGTTVPDGSSMLDVKASDKGILLPRLTDAQRASIPSPANGLLIYNTSTNKFNYYISSNGWYELCSSLLTTVTGSVSAGGGLSINSISTTPANSAMLDIDDDSHSRGILIPRLTSAVTSPATGLIYYNTISNNFYFYDGTAWNALAATFITSTTGGGSQNSVGVAINTSGSIADASAILDIDGTNKGILIPRITTEQRNNISPASGLSIYNTDNKNIEYYHDGTGAGWYKVEAVVSAPSAGAHSATQTQITWNWNTVTGATGYKWHTASIYSAATDMSTSTSKIETGLTCNTTYSRYVWAYNTCGNSSATNLTQTASSCFSCGYTLTDPRDGQTYSTVQIGTQCWMKQNLNYGTYITAVLDGQTPSGIQKYCYSNNTANCNTYGALYVWTEIMNGSNSCNGTNSSQPNCSTPVTGICPSNWHIPSHYEWIVLEKTVGSCPSCFPYNITTTGSLGTNEGNNLKESGTTHWATANGTNTSNFTGLPGGTYSFGWFSLGNSALLWSSTEYDATTAWERYLNNANGFVLRTNDDKTFAVAVRCVCSPSSVPTTGTHTPTETQIIWNWNTVSETTGYKWNTANTYSTAIDMGTNVTKTETGLIACTIYTRYVWAYNNCGNSSVTKLTQTTSNVTITDCGIITDTRDGQTYPTVQVGTQCWMAQNLNIGTKIIGSIDQTNNSTLEKYCYSNNTNNCTTYGGLYQWAEMVQYYNGSTNSSSWSSAPTGYVQGICPSGWHIPYESEWAVLQTTLGGNTVAGGKLKETGTTYWMSPNTSATNCSGFYALPSGRCQYSNSFFSLYSEFFLYTLTEWNESTGSAYYLAYNKSRTYFSQLNKSDAASLRCLKDCSPAITLPTAGIHVPARSQIVWNWNSVSGATGYKWNTINWYESAIDMGINTSKTETAIGCNTSFTRYVWAYNICGPTNSILLTEVTTDCCDNQSTMTDSRDGSVYSIVEIGTQCWMAQNLNIGTKIIGSIDQTNNSTLEKYCYNDNSTLCNTYGGLYQWAEAVQYLNGATNSTSWSPAPSGNVQGICPSGWHIPTYGGWVNLTTTLGDAEFAGGKMKETGTAHWDSPNTGADNSSGFTALGSGEYNSGFSSLLTNAYWWSSSNISSIEATSQIVLYNSIIVNTEISNKVRGMSVRCVKD